MRFLEYMGFVLAVFPLKYGFIIVQVPIPGSAYIQCIVIYNTQSIQVQSATEITYSTVEQKYEHTPSIDWVPFPLYYIFHAACTCLTSIK